MQETPDPGVNSIPDNDEGRTSEENIPLPDDEPKPAPVEEPPDTQKEPINEDQERPKQIV